MKIALLDIDSKIPNLALMKLSTYFKTNGDNVDFIKFNYSAYPKKKKKEVFIAKEYDQVWCSIIFTSNKDSVEIKECNNLFFGGTGYDLKVKLSEEIDKLSPDYSIYPENNLSYGFITRGCIRNCYFCFVPKKEGKIKRYDNIENIVKHKKVVFMDNNILAYSKHKEIFQEIIDKKLHLTFNQGLDIRLIDEENAYLLSLMNYTGEYIFAFDDISYKTLIEDKYKIVKKYIKKDWKIKFYIYCNPQMEIKEIKDRVEWCADNKALPYIMRDFSCWEDKNKDFYTDIAAWCNQPGIFKNMDFKEFLHRRHKQIKNISKRSNRINSVLKEWEQC